MRESSENINGVKQRVIGISADVRCLVAGQLVAEHARDHLTFDGWSKPQLTIRGNPLRTVAIRLSRR